MRPIGEFLDSSVGDEYVVTQPSMLSQPPPLIKSVGLGLSSEPRVD